MLIIELTNGDVKTAQIVYCDITFKENILAIEFQTNRGKISYEVTTDISGGLGDDLESIRDKWLEALNTGYFKIKEYPERKYVYINGVQYTAWRVEEEIFNDMA